ncbi:TPA: hypothetical protein NEG48_003070 [Elizabethkingia anophelis]|nr:hypothetical protein [Elizabethkingia anophelis]
MKEEEQKSARKLYIAPQVNVIFVEMEEGISAMSAMVQVNPNQPSEQWDTEDQSGELEW